MDQEIYDRFINNAVKILSDEKRDGLVANGLQSPQGMASLVHLAIESVRKGLEQKGVEVTQDTVKMVMPEITAVVLSKAKELGVEVSKETANSVLMLTADLVLGKAARDGELDLSGIDNPGAAQAAEQLGLVAQNDGEYPQENPPEQADNVRGLFNG